MKHAASVYMWAALALCALGLSGAIADPTGAQAAPAPTFHWCPGQQWDPGWGSIYDWDWNHCHDWERAAGQGGAMGIGESRRRGRRRSHRHRRGPRAHR
jgi:hypothetical protein